MNIKDIQQTFQNMNDGLVSQRNVIFQMQIMLEKQKTDMEKLKKELGELCMKVEDLAFVAADQEDVEGVEVVER